MWFRIGTSYIIPVMALSIRIESVSAGFNGKPAVRDLTFEAGAGKATVILGPSGSGKTTTLRIIAGLTRPDSGRVFIGDSLASGPGIIISPSRRRIGMVFQSLALWPHMTVEGNLKFVSDRTGRDGRIEKALSLVGLLDRRKNYPAELSGGEQQRVALARALVSEPEILLLDEPLASLDDALRRKMLDFMSDLRSRIGVTAVLVTHNREEALAFADSIVVMKDGCIRQQGSPSDIWNRPAGRFVASLLGENNLLDAEFVREGVVKTVLGEFKSPSGMTGKRVCAAIRPADLEIGPGGGARISGRVLGSAFRGGRYLVRIDVSGAEVAAESHNALREGEIVGLSLRRDPQVPEDV